MVIPQEKEKGESLFKTNFHLEFKKKKIQIIFHLLMECIKSSFAKKIL